MSRDPIESLKRREAHDPSMFSKEQLEYISKVELEFGIYKASKLMNPGYSVETMSYIATALRNGFATLPYENVGYNAQQLNLIYEGQLEGIDVNVYAGPHNSIDFMQKMLNFHTNEKRALEIVKEHGLPNEYVESLNSAITEGLDTTILHSNKITEEVLLLMLDGLRYRKEQEIEI